MYFQSYGLNVSVIEERHLNLKKTTDFLVKEEEERRKKSQIQSEGGSYLEMEETQKGARETRRRGDRLGDKESSKQRSPFFLSLLRKAIEFAPPWAHPLSGFQSICIAQLWWLLSSWTEERQTECLDWRR